MSFRDPTLPPAGATRRSNPGLTRLLLLILLGLVALLGYLAYNRQYRSHPVNAFQPGAELDVEAFLEKGKTTIVDFYSNYCPPCRKISPLLTKLEKKRPDLAVINVNINRRGVKGIDWSSPVARQYNLKSIPHFRIYDGEGNLLQEGQEAYVWIMTMLARAGISE
ncbi:MAG: thioredoxin family protein [Candidatus Aminicenantes bacterium]|nr:thioredoxin family protein [Candidatus Aminicenantes bacterium]